MLRRPRGGELVRCQLAQRPLIVGVIDPAADDDLRLGQRAEDLAGEQLLFEATVEGPVNACCHVTPGSMKAVARRPE